MNHKLKTPLPPPALYLTFINTLLKYLHNYLITSWLKNLCLFPASCLLCLFTAIKSVLIRVIRGCFLPFHGNNSWIVSRKISVVNLSVLIRVYLPLVFLCALWLLCGHLVLDISICAIRICLPSVARRAKDGCRISIFAFRICVYAQFLWYWRSNGIIT